MIEVPEATVLARQIDARLRGRRIVHGSRGNAPHKFAFVNRTPTQYEEILAGRTVGKPVAHGSMLMVPLEPCYTLVLGGGGERILHHADGDGLPDKRQLELEFDDGSWLTVTVQGWGNVLLLDRQEARKHPHAGPGRVSALDRAFTRTFFEALFGELEPDDARSVKYFVISQPGAWGVGNGYLQDILFRARLHPRRRAAELKREQRRGLHRAIVAVLREAVEAGGRDTERDLLGRPGGYRVLLDSRSAGQPCPECGTAIEKTPFLGGSCYFCPGCQT